MRRAAHRRASFAPKQAKQHFVGRASVFGVVLETRALEVLHGVFLPGIGARGLEWLGDRQAHERQAAKLLPARQERLAERVAAFGEEGAVAAGVAGEPLKGWLGARLGEVPAE